MKNFLRIENLNPWKLEKKVNNVMYKERVLLNFSKDIINQPITSQLIKKYNVTVNILQAQIFPQEEGQLIVELQNENEDDLKQGIDFLKEAGVEVQLLKETINLDKKACMNCGACVGVCKPGALSLNKNTWELEVDQSKCFLCETCISVCPVNALELQYREFQGVKK